MSTGTTQLNILCAGFYSRHIKLRVLDYDRCQERLIVSSTIVSKAIFGKEIGYYSYFGNLYEEMIS